MCFDIYLEIEVVGLEEEGFMEIFKEKIYNRMFRCVFIYVYGIFFCVWKIKVYLMKIWLCDIYVLIFKKKLNFLYMYIVYRVFWSI